ncbi:MAG: D-2-hydroxyacid dehydrogenase [Sedimentisphaerales bacterium]|nr:D-2-hydroxyacid dehydrogenase [Sedimentisphaerales bacterium]
MKNVLVDMKIHDQGLGKLQAISGVNVTLVPEPAEIKRPLPAELIEDKHILFCSTPAENFSDMKSIEFIQIASAGYSQLFGLSLVEKKVRACNARGVFDVPIAEWNVSMMVNLARNLRQMIRNQQTGTWDRSAVFQREIRGSVVGLWGYGSIARETARLAKQMGMKVHVMDIAGVNPFKNIYSVPGTGDSEGKLPDKVFSVDQKKEFLSGLDYLILAMPLTKNTEGIVGEEDLKALPRHAFLLNPARGPLIKEQSLLKALREGWITGAALDTHYHYPMPADHPLWRFPNVIMTPHISGSSLSPHFTERIWDIFCQNVQRYILGKPLLNELSPRQLDGQ